MYNSSSKTSSTNIDGFNLQDMVDFVNNAVGQGHALDSKVRVKVKTAFHPDGGLLKTITVNTERPKNATR